MPGLSIPGFGFKRASDFELGSLAREGQRCFWNNTTKSTEMSQLQEVSSAAFYLVILASVVILVSSTYNNSGKPVRFVLYF